MFSNSYIPCYLSSHEMGNCTLPDNSIFSQLMGWMDLVQICASPRNMINMKLTTIKTNIVVKK